MTENSMAGRVIAITGAASGIGRATALIAAARGAGVAILDVNQEAADRVTAEITALGGRAVGITADVCDEPALVAADERIAAELGPVFGLVTAAGISVAAKAEDLAVEDWNRVFNVNALGTFLPCRTFGRGMIARRDGAIVAIGSISGMGGQASRAAYVASKFAVSGLVKCLAVEWGRHNVRVNCIAPTVVETPLLRAGVPASFIDAMIDRTPMARNAQPDDIARAALMLMSDDAAYITGVHLPVDGGVTSGFFTRRSGEDLSSIRLLEAGVYTE